jgi:hypothetical protein
MFYPWPAAMTRFDVISDIYGSSDHFALPIPLSGRGSKSSAKNRDILVSLG